MIKRGVFKQLKVGMALAATGVVLSFAVAGFGWLPVAKADGVYGPDAFVFEVDTRGLAPETSLTIVSSIDDYDYNYNIDCNGDGEIDISNVQYNRTRVCHYDRTRVCHYDEPGVYTVVITGQFPSLRFNRVSGGYRPEDNAAKIVSAKQWGIQQRLAMDEMFLFARKLNNLPSSAPDLSKTTTTQDMFARSESFN